MSDLLLAEQAWWDRKQFDPELGYTLLDRRDQKANHIQLHIAKAALKLVASDSPLQLVAGDLAIYRSQLMNMYNIDGSHLLEQELDDSLDQATRHIVQANGELAYYLESRQHGRSADVLYIDAASAGLHLGANTIANLIEIPLPELHRVRMEELLGESLPDPLV